MKKNVLIAFALFFGGISMFAQKDDSFLNLMKGELQYNMETLKTKELPPYYMTFRVNDVYSATISSSFGALTSNRESHERRFIPQIRVGSPALDNFKYSTQGLMQQGNGGALGTRVPLEDDAVEGIRQAIWSETLKRYRLACSVYEQVKTKVQTNADDEDKSPCFSKAPVEKYYEPQLLENQRTINRDAWAKRMNEISAVFKSCPDLESGEASLMFNVERTYLVTSEGSEVVKNRVSARIMLSVSAKADDGMVLPLSKDYFAFSPDELPSNDVIIADAKDIVKRVLALKTAPVADPYTGPAIMSGAASGVFFHEIFGHRLEGHRLKTGGQTFKKMIGEKVLPESFQVYCDPTLRRYGNNDMNGYYLYDDEGVKARRVDNVVNGVLKEFLMSRVPLDGFPKSNGHGRASSGMDPVSRQSNLIVETTSPYTEAQMRQMLIDEAKKQGKEYGYYYKSVTSGFTYTGEGGSLNSFNVTPLEVYRVFVDGRPDQLVRGVDMIGTPLSMFSNIVAAGGITETFTGSCGAESGWAPVTATSPMIYISKIETQRRQQQRDIPALLPAPTVTNKVSTSVDETIFSAMEDELKRNKEQLVLEGQPRPFYLSYSIGRFHQTQVSASLGGTISYNVIPWSMTGGIDVQVGNYAHSSFIQAGQIAEASMPQEADYDVIRRNLWLGSDQMYKYNLNMGAQKTAFLNANPLPPLEAAVNDMQQLVPKESITSREESNEMTPEEMKQLATELSTLFKEYPELYDSKVSLNAIDVDMYRVTSEDIKLKEPHGFAEMVASAKVRANDGSVLSGGCNYFFSKTSKMFSREVMKQKISQMADDLMAQKEAAAISEYYNGPVMFEESTVGISLARNIAGAYLLATRSFPPRENASYNQIGRPIVDEKLTIKHYSNMPTYQGEELIGNYTIDGDGVEPAKELTLVEKGVLKRQLNERYPAVKSPISTGNGCFVDNPASGAAIQTAPGILHVQSSKTMAMSRMKKKLLKVAKNGKHAYAYIVRCDVGSDILKIYRVDVKSGEETLVRSNVRLELNALQLLHINGISAEEEVVNYQFGSVNSSIIYPKAMLVDSYEIQAVTPRVEKEPEIPYPLLRDKK